MRQSEAHVRPSVLTLPPDDLPAGYVRGVSKFISLRPRPRVLEFFAGIGLARLGLERAGFDVVWSNDYEPDKYAMYEAHFRDGPGHSYFIGDIGNVDLQDFPADTQLAWASSPCTDLSLAGSRAGLRGRESSAFWLWVDLLRRLNGDAPSVIVLENVTGLASSRGGDDLRAAIRGLNDVGYSIDILVLDARRFLPQSRARLFLVGSKNPPVSGHESSELRPTWTDDFFGDLSLVTHRAPLPDPPPYLNSGLGEAIEDIPHDDTRWWGYERTTSFINSLSPIQLGRVSQMRSRPVISYRAAYRRTRGGVATWEVRADDVSGCLRTARGGSSKQAVVRLGNGDLRIRWMTPLEYARLMGAGDFDLSGGSTNQALFAFGDAVAVPVVEWLASEYLYPLVMGEFSSKVLLKASGE